MRFRFVSNGQDGPPGSLQVNVNDAATADPLDNAQVTITQPDTQVLVGQFTRGQWERGWRPLYLAVLAWCHQQESTTQARYGYVTR